MMKKTLLTGMLGLSTLFLSHAAFADAVSELKSKLSEMTTFKANFQQKVTDEQGEILQTGAGSLALAQPLKIHWQQKEPDQTMLVSDGRRAYYYDEFAEQVTIMASLNLIETTPFVLLTTDSKAQWDKYQVTKIAQNYKITPQVSTESQVESLELHFNGENQLAKILVVDLSGQLTEFNFSSIKLNDTLDNNLFSFTIPEHVVIDDQTQGE
jgi:outer membrane lipoprotein carrier protein